jgi:hypothetical protein
MLPGLDRISAAAVLVRLLYSSTAMPTARTSTFDHRGSIVSPRWTIYQDLAREAHFWPFTSFKADIVCPSTAGTGLQSTRKACRSLSRIIVRLTGARQSNKAPRQDKRRNGMAQSSLLQNLSTAAELRMSYVRLRWSPCPSTGSIDHVCLGTPEAELIRIQLQLNHLPFSRLQRDAPKSLQLPHRPR